MTQASNLAVIASALFILLRTVQDGISSLTEGDILTVLSALVAIGAGAMSFYGRYRIGDLKPLGSRKPEYPRS